MRIKKLSAWILCAHLLKVIVIYLKNMSLNSQYSVLAFSGGMDSTSLLLNLIKNNDDLALILKPKKESLLKEVLGDQYNYLFQKRNQPLGYDNLISKETDIKNILLDQLYLLNIK